MKGFHSAPGCMIAFWALCLLSACISADVGPSFEASNVAKFKVGTTTRAEVIAMFGAPSQRIETANGDRLSFHFGDEGTAVIYFYWHGQGNLFHHGVRVLETEFSGGGVLVDYHFLSTFHNETVPRSRQETNFDVILAQRQVIPGKTMRAEVCSLLGTNFLVVPFNKEGVAQRWHYSYSELSKTRKILFAGAEGPEPLSKSLDVDFDSAGTVLHVQGDSDFPEDRTHK